MPSRMEGSISTVRWKLPRVMAISTSEWFLKIKSQAGLLFQSCSSTSAGLPELPILALRARRSAIWTAATMELCSVAAAGS